MASCVYTLIKFIMSLKQGMHYKHAKGGRMQ